VSSNEITSKLKFTRERFIPEETDADSADEWFVRHVYARMFCSRKTAIDSGCGVGYGSFHVAEYARRVVGLDNDAKEIQYARSRYSFANTFCLVGDGQNLPFDGESFKVVTFFELIEHLTDPGLYLAEAAS
jgi:ubiquinone/menaquinone biosynthesis C-methylase UbiE